MARSQFTSIMSHDNRSDHGENNHFHILADVMGNQIIGWRRKVPINNMCSSWGIVSVHPHSFGISSFTIRCTIKWDICAIQNMTP